jgi:hypothetical protein
MWENSGREFPALRQNWSKDDEQACETTNSQRK